MTKIFADIKLKQFCKLTDAKQYSPIDIRKLVTKAANTRPRKFLKLKMSSQIAYYYLKERHILWFFALFIINL